MTAMEKRVLIIIVLFLLVLASCTAKTELAGNRAALANIDKEPASELVVLPADAPNMVDERFELLSLVFRLAGREEYGDVNTAYQQRLASEFAAFKKHRAVKYAAGLPIGYDAVFKFAVNILKADGEFIFLDDTDSLFEDGRWSVEAATEFLILLNDFYMDSDFFAFYQDNLDFYLTETKLFIEATYSDIDLEWFGKYVNTNNLICVYTPSSSRYNYGAVVNDSVVYCGVSNDGSEMVYEFCHSIGNPLAREWYDGNADFKRLCDDTVDPIRLPNYTDSETIAREYITRAYSVLYHAEHGYALPLLLDMERDKGFSYIEDVYAIIAPYRETQSSDDPIVSALGVQYSMGEEQIITIGNRVIRWQLLSLAEPLPATYYRTEVGNVISSKTGDVIYMEDSAGTGPILLVDLGATTYQGKEGYRSYCQLPLE